MARDIIIPIRVTGMERDRVDVEAKRLGITRAEVLRNLINMLPAPNPAQPHSQEASL